ncbi:TatD DNase family protein [Peptoclostridium litorale DSM 5388]|uniref:Putative deoxyribonuclease n=1 Tax=Peptoclostridium litorale DSM 5388 TaxID=1121324 RepID=A0A069RB19_PEPLI|nr:TatD family hydrolase [Peptoclostridium litorale]KDR94254.1 putative deoxyribonuclease [Peptoclostridium litorale DSM 5388]SIO28168.1 TatD DNase family protein [Peptoclostridium litorale DSM 5388]
MLFDTHAHITDEKFDSDRQEILKAIEESKVEYVVNPAVDIPSSVQAIKLAKENSFVYAAVGVHPHEAKDFDEDSIDVLRELAKSQKVVAIGEIGLDYYYDFSPRDIQKKFFRMQIELANELNLPIIVHDRDAHADTMEIIKKFKKAETGCVLHCYSGSAEMAMEYVKMGCYISIAGPVTFKNNKKGEAVVREVPIERLLIETDSPYLTPHPYRGKRNDPTKVEYVADKIAQIKGMSYEKACDITTENAKNFFGID